MSKPNEDVLKLPTWAQTLINRLTYRADEAERKLSEFLDRQTKSPFFCEDWMSPKAAGRHESVSRPYYIQTEQVCVRHGGVLLSVHVKPEGVELRWRSDGRITEYSPCVPTSFQTLLLPTARNAPAAATVEDTSPQRVRRQRR